MIIDFIKKYSLPIAILVGAMGYKYLGYLNFLTPYLIFTMLFLTFSKIDYSNLKPSWLHLWLILAQIVLSTLIFYLFRPFNIVVAQGLMICIICPTATAAAVITSKLRGNFEFVASYTIYINLVVAIFIPFIFPFMSPINNNIGFISLFGKIFQKVFPLLICPFILAVIVRKFRWLNNLVQKSSFMAFYIWATALTIVIADIVKYFIENINGGKTMFLLVFGALAVCLFQFFIGKIFGKYYGNKIAAGQSLGQKNTIFAIWLANIYFGAAVSVGAGAYVIWQNIFNSIQLYIAESRQKKL